MIITNTNTIPRPLDTVIALAIDVELALRKHGTAVGVLHNQADDVLGDKQALIGLPSSTIPPEPGTPVAIGKQPAYEQARGASLQARIDARAAVASARGLCAASTDVLRLPLGRRWNSNWVPAGYTGGSLAVPQQPDARLSSLRAYFRLHPEHANPLMGVTEAAIDAVLNSLAQSRGAVQDAQRAEALAKQERDDALTQLRRRLSAVRNELELLLAADDPRWLDFGFNRPADRRFPAQPGDVVVLPGLPGQFQVSWTASARAGNYRVTQAIVGAVPAETVEVGLFADTATNVSGLPSGATVIIGVSARNDVGETQPVLVSAVVP
jgi:hypothetical protein